MWQVFQTQLGQYRQVWIWCKSCHQSIFSNPILRFSTKCQWHMNLSFCLRCSLALIFFDSVSCPSLGWAWLSSAQACLKFMFGFEVRNWSLMLMFEAGNSKLKFEDAFEGEVWSFICSGSLKLTLEDEVWSKSLTFMFEFKLQFF